MGRWIWVLRKAYYRSYHMALGVAVRCLRFPKQKIISKTNGLLEISKILIKNNIQKVCVVCSKSVRKTGGLDEMLQSLKCNGISYVIFEDINPNPTIENVEKGANCYQSNHCQALIAVGGGSPMDCAKGIGLKISNPNMSYSTMKKLVVRKRFRPLFVAVPTTAGSGSESTVAAVISNPAKKEKYAIISFKAVPKYVILEEELTLKLPAQVTAYTGMDALTHAIEAYIGTISTSYTKGESLKAIRLIHENLITAYSDGGNRIARKNMLLASNHAANAFTRVYVGYVHAISHALSALYDVGHGKTNAIVLPHVLKYYGKSIEKKLAEIARSIELGCENESDESLAEKMIDWIEEMNQKMNIPDKLVELQEHDIDVIVKKALREANPDYPVPRIMDYEDGVQLVKKLL